jgi:hypothetical protein
MATLSRPRPPRRLYTAVPNTWVRDSTLTWEDRGLLAWLMSHEDGRPIDEAAVIAAGPAARDKVRAMLRRLVAGGYLVMQRVRDRAGRLARGTVWQVRDPHVLIDERPATDGKPVPGDDQAERDVSPGQSTDGKPVRGFLSSIREDQKNKKKTARTRGTSSPKDTPMTRRRKDPNQPAITGMSRELMRTRRGPEPSAQDAAKAADLARLIRAESDSIVAAWSAWCALNGGAPIPAVVRQVELVVQSLVTDGVATPHIKLGLADWTATGMPVSVLVSCVNAAATGHRPQSRGARQRQLRDEETRQLIERARQRDELEAAGGNPMIELFGAGQQAVGW